MILVIIATGLNSSVQTASNKPQSVRAVNERSPLPLKLLNNFWKIHFVEKAVKEENEDKHLDIPSL